jgi:hypothetical protein
MEHITDFLLHHHTRKGQIKTALTPIIAAQLSTLYGTNEAQKHMWSIHQQALAIKLEIKKGRLLEEGLRAVLVERAKKTICMDCRGNYVLEMDKQNERQCVAMSDEGLVNHREAYRKILQNIERDGSRARDVLREYLVDPEA